MQPWTSPRIICLVAVYAETVAERKRVSDGFMLDTIMYYLIISKH
jgi:hypothetical protein